MQSVGRLERSRSDRRYDDNGAVAGDDDVQAELQRSRWNRHRFCGRAGWFGAGAYGSDDDVGREPNNHSEWRLEHADLVDDERDSLYCVGRLVG